MPGQLLPVPVTATVHIATSTTITSMVAILQHRLDWFTRRIPVEHYHLGHLWLAQCEELQAIGVP